MELLWMLEGKVVDVDSEWFAPGGKTNRLY